jgi:AAA15 family ATPase/GTPase
METTHSKTRRAKSSSPKIVIQSWNDVWESFGKDNTLTTIEAMNAEGWKTVDQVIKMTGLSNARIYNLIREEKFEREKKKVKDGGVVKIINFVRPKC